MENWKGAESSGRSWTEGHVTTVDLGWATSNDLLHAGAWGLHQITAWGFGPGRMWFGQGWQQGLWGWGECLFYSWRLQTNWPLMHALLFHWPFSQEWQTRPSDCGVINYISPFPLSLSFSLPHSPESGVLVCVVHLPWCPKLNILVMSDQPQGNPLFSFSAAFFLFHNDSLLVSLQAHFSLLLSLFNLKYQIAWLQNVLKGVLENGGNKQIPLTRFTTTQKSG